MERKGCCSLLNDINGGVKIRIRQIPWENFSEEEIHLLLTVFFEEEGFNVYNLHRVQRSEEKGSDLLVERDGLKVAIAVKKRPRSKDIGQLALLCKRKEGEKWYVYIKDPTPVFRAHMKDYPEIKFISKKELNDYLFSLNPSLYTSILLQNQKFSYLLMEIAIFLMKLWRKTEEGRKGKRMPLDEDSLSILWRLKDDTASLHKTFRFTQMMFESIEDKEPNVEEDVVILEGFLEGLKYLREYCRNILRFLKEFYEKNKDFTHYVVEKTKIRSNWLMICSFRLLIPKLVENIISEEKHLEKSLRKLKNNIREDSDGMLNRLTEISFDKNNIFYPMSGYCRYTANFMYSVEAFIDDLFSYNVFNEYSTQVLKKDPEFSPFFEDEEYKNQQ